MRFYPVRLPVLSCVLLACASLLAAPAARADSRIFIVENQSDGYGVDQCLASGEICGAHAAASYRRVDPDEVTGSVPKSSASCTHSGCAEYVAITCQR